jgi:hypothetical protein
MSSDSSFSLCLPALWYAALDLRVRHVRKGGVDYYLLFNEGAGELGMMLDLSAKGRQILLDPPSSGQGPVSGGSPIHLAGHALRVLVVA